MELDTMVLDSFGDDLPKWKTSVHLYSFTGSDNTSEIIPNLQPQFNNSFELHMQSDRNLCVGPDVNRARGLRNGTPMVVKRDCANTMNHVYEGQQLRVNNTNFCVDIPNADFKLLKKIQYHTCNQSNAQLLKLVALESASPTRPGSCYRRSNASQPCHNMPIPNGYERFTWTGGVPATLTFYITQPDSITDTWEIGTGGASVSKSKTTGAVAAFRYYTHDHSGDIKVPFGAQTYSINPWN
jgi:hypothetical protein